MKNEINMKVRGGPDDSQELSRSNNCPPGTRLPDRFKFLEGGLVVKKLYREFDQIVEYVRLNATDKKGFPAEDLREMFGVADKTFLRYLNHIREDFPDIDVIPNPADRRRLFLRRNRACFKKNQPLGCSKEPKPEKPEKKRAPLQRRPPHNDTFRKIVTYVVQNPRRLIPFAEVRETFDIHPCTFAINVPKITEKISEIKVMADPFNGSKRVFGFNLPELSVCILDYARANDGNHNRNR